jgi:hypothetical protein
MFPLFVPSAVMPNVFHFFLQPIFTLAAPHGISADMIPLIWKVSLPFFSSLW